MDSKEVFKGIPSFECKAEKEATSDVLPFSERMGQLAAMIVMVVIIAFFVIHQTRPTGFFTDEFCSSCAVLLFGMLIMGIPPALVRFITGRKNLARLFDTANLVVGLIGGIFLLMKFPFDFAHFADPLPHYLEFMIDWISATFAKAIMVIGIVVSAIMVVYNPLLYFAVKDYLDAESSEQTVVDSQCSDDTPPATPPESEI